MSSVTGVDFTQRFTAGAVDGAVQVYAGRYHDDFNLDGDTYDMELRKAGGIVLSGNVGDFGARLSYHQAGFYINGLNPLSTQPRKLDALAGLAMMVGADVVPEGQTSRFYQAALSWDNGSTSLTGEYTALRHDSDLLVDDDAWFVSAAQRMGAFTPHLTFAQATDNLKSGSTGIAQRFTEDKQNSLTLGVRYDFALNTALKLEATYVERESADSRAAEATSIIKTAQANSTPPNTNDLIAASKKKLDKTDGMLYTLGLSVMF
ncbi:MAG: porin [Venatoribacter sp.]